MRSAKILSILVAVVLMVMLFSGFVNTARSSSSSTKTTFGTGNPPMETGDGYEEGTSGTDNIVNTTAADKVILVVSFGTSYNQSRNLTIGGIETAIKNAYPDYQVRRAFTSQIIIDKLAKCDGLRIDNVTEAMNRLVLDKVKDVVILPTTIMNGIEYDNMIAEIMPFADRFESFRVGKNLLFDDSDYDAVAELIVNETSQFRADGTSIVFMGHGTEHESNAIYEKLQSVLAAKSPFRIYARRWK